MKPPTTAPSVQREMLQLATQLRSKDGTVKYLWTLQDGQTVESVYLPLANRGAKGPSICVSSQVGCAVRCVFCATGKKGLLRNLTPGEIVAQVTTTLHRCGTTPDAFDVSFMGMGEPLHNLGNVQEAMRALHARYSAEADVHFSLSTIGIAKKIYELADFELPVALQVSLHGATDTTRDKLIPQRSSGSISELFKAIRHYATAHHTSVNLNYLLFDELNDTDECALQLVELLADEPHVRLKLSHYNPIDGNDLNPTSDSRKNRFMTMCVERGLHVFDWKSMGVDISGGCGQLRSSTHDNSTS